MTATQPRTALVDRPDPLAVLGRDLTVALTGGAQARYVNLDYAATAPCLAAAARAVTDLLPWYASVHRGAGAPSQLCTRRYEHARTSVSAFLRCRTGDAVVFCRNTTDALNLLARTLPGDALAVTFAGDHHACLLPWRRTLRLPVPDSPAAAVRSVHGALRELRRGGSTAPLLLAVTGASNVTGELWPIAELTAVAHRHDARVVLDAAQLAPHRPIDVTGLGVDYVVLSGHKLYAPFGAGVLAGRADWLDAAPPYLAGGGATRHVGDATNDVVWQRGPQRHEAGTPNLLGAVALGAVCDALRDADREDLACRERALLARLRGGLAGIPGVHELHAFGAGHPRVGITAFAVAGQDSAALAERLSAGYGIGVRDGLFCAHPLTRRLLGEAAARAGVALPPTAVRASLGLGTTDEDVDRLIDALRAVTRG